MTATREARPGPGKRNCRKLVITGLCVVAGLVAAEVGVRLFEIDVTHPPESRGHMFRKSADPRLRFTNDPGAALILDFGTDRERGPQVVRHAINEQGFRGPVVTEKPEPGVLRIACIGDSHTLGHGVAEHQTWPAHLARELARRLPERRFEVMNCGVSAYDTQQEAQFLASVVLPYEPQLVLLQFHINDIMLPGVAGAHKVAAGFLMRLSDPHAGGAVATLRRSSRCVDLVLDGVYRRQGLKKAVAALSLEYTERGPRYHLVSSALISMRDQLKERGLPFAVVLYPYLLRDGEHLASRAAFEVVREFCRASSIACFDTEAAFLAHRDIEALRVHQTDVHAGALAHRTFAVAIAGQLLAQGDLLAR